MAKLYSVLVTILIFFFTGNAQVSNYSFSQSTTTYTPISGTDIVATGWNDGTGAVTLPFGFTFNGVTYFSASVNSNGYLTFGATLSAGNSYSPISSTAGYSGAISAFGSNLIANGFAIQGAVSGTAPNRTYIIQWNNAQRFNGGAVTGDVLNFQIRLQEGGGVAANQTIQVVYGNCTATNTTALSHQVGLRGTANTDYNNRFISFNWSSSAAGTSSFAACTTSNTLMPANGLTFTWTPPVPCVTPVAQPTNLVLAAPHGSQINGSFTAATGSPSGHLVVRYPAGATPTSPVSGTAYIAGNTLGAGTVVFAQPTTVTGFALTGLVPLTSYDFYVYAYNTNCIGTPAYLTTNPLFGTITMPAQAVPNCSATFSPGDGSTGVPVTQNLLWSSVGATPSTTGYHVYLSVNSALVAAENPSVRVATVTTSSYTPTNLNYSTTYYWKVVPINALGSPTGCLVNSFTTYVPTTVTSKPGGGLWSSPATWQSGTVPVAGDDVVITDGSIVTVDIAVTGIRNLTIGQGSSGIVQWNNSSNALTLFGNLTVNPGARFLPFTTGSLFGQTVNIGGNFVNNGYCNLAVQNTFIRMNGGLQNGGSANQNISGVGTFVGNATHGIIDGLSFHSTGNSSISTSRNLVTANFGLTLGNLNTNGKLSIDNTAQVAGQALNTQVANVVVTGMGAGFATAPVAFGASVTAWTASGTASSGLRYYAGTRVYLCTAGGIFNATTAPSHTAGTTTNGTATLLWLGSLGTIGNPFSLSTTTVGTQYFYANNLYTCTIAGVPDAAFPPVHISGVVITGTAAFRYAGTAATVTVNHDAVTQTVRSLNLVNPGSGYTNAPFVTISGSFTQAAGATTSVLRPITGAAVSSVEKSGGANLDGGLTINSNQSALSQSGVGNVAVPLGGVNYTVAPVVGFGGPTGINLVTAGGSNYTTAPTITVSGGTLVSGNVLTSADFTIIVQQRKVVSVYLNSAASAIYSVPPALSFTGGGGSGATLAFPAGCWPTATAIIGSNGQLSDVTVTNAGYGYVTAPAVAVGNTSGTTVGGTFTTVASAMFCTIALYDLTINNLPPTSASVANADDAVIPATRKLNRLRLGIGTTTTGNLNLNNNLELFGASNPLIINTGILNLGGNTLLISSPLYIGASGTATAHVTNGAITLSLPGGSNGGVGLNYPFDATFFIYPGSASGVTDGSTVTSLTVSRTGAPTGGAIGTRAYRVVTNSGAVYGTSPNITLYWNGRDSLVSDNTSLRISQAAALSGPWTVKSLASGSGPVSATGNRSTPLTTAPGPIVPTGDDYFAWTSTYTPPPALAYAVTRTINNVYQSIAPAAQGGDGTGTLSTATGDETPQIAVNISAAGFVYQGSPVTAMSIHPNGYISLHNAYAAYVSDNSWDNTLAAISNGYTNGTIGAGKRNVIAPFYDDLNKTTPVIYYKIAGSKITVEWFNTTVFALSGPQLYFQAVLDATDQSITFNYGNMQLYNGTQNIRYSYTSGISGGFINAIPKPGQIMQQQYENTAFFTHENGLTANWGANGLSISPTPRSSVKFTPGAYVPVAPPASLPPANDEPAGAILRPALPAFPGNIAWDTITNTTNLFTTRFATNTAIPAICGGAGNARDVWFKFIAPNPSVTVRIYGSGGFIPRVSVYDSLLVPLPNCTAGAQGLTATATATGLTVNKTYFVRVHHETTGTQATATASVSNGAVTGLTITPGTNYSVPATAYSFYDPQNQGPRISFSGGGGSGAAAAFTTPVATTSVQTVTGSNISFTGGSGYTSAPAVTIESPDWGITGEFGIVLFSLPENDECSGAIALTNLSNTDCVTGQNAAVGNTRGATASPEAAACDIPDDDLWYKFTATEALALIKVQATGSLNTAFQVFDGGAGPGACASKIPMSCVNATLPTGLDSITLATTIGHTYFVRVYHAGTGAVINDNFSICVSSARPACVAAPISPANNGQACPGPVVFRWPKVSTASMYYVYLNAGSGPATSLAFIGTDTGYVQSNLSPGAYSWRVESVNTLGVSTGCSDFTFTVNAPSNVFITPTGSISLCAPAAQTIALTATSAASPAYQWLNGGVPVAGATNASISANVTGQYRLLVTDGITGCSDTSGIMAVTIVPAPNIVITPAAATISCDSVKLSVLNGYSSIKITEVTLFKSGTGQTAVYPAYVSPLDGDFVEISNVSAQPVPVGGYRFDDYLTGSSSSNHPYFIPAGTVIPPSGVLVLHLGTGNDDAGNLYFNTGGLSGIYVSNSQAGFVIRDSTGNVADAVGLGGSAAGSYTFAAATGVAAADWAGFVPNVSGFAGAIRTAALDTNTPADWAISNTPSPLQSLGTFNGGYSMSPLPATWSPATGLFTNAALTTPYTSGSFSQLYARPGSTTTYTLQANNSGCPGSKTVTVTVLAPGTLEWLGTVSTDWANAANWKCGIVPTTTTDVVINGGAPNYPLITLNVEVRSLTVLPGAVVNIAPGFEIKLNGN